MGFMVLSLIGWTASAGIVFAYLRLSVGVYPNAEKWLHLANALCGIPLLVIEITSGAWGVLPLTLAFTVLGWWGILRPEKRN